MERHVQNSYTLKQCAMSRILLDMINETKNAAGEGTFVLIVVDVFTAKILSSFLTMTELLNKNIFSVEQLDLPRQRFPKYHAIYFVSPTVDSCKRIAEDFKDENKPQYSRVHIFLSHRIMDNTMEELVTPFLVQRVKTFKELNLAFLTRDLNLFDIGMGHALEIFTLKGAIERRDQILSNVLERLFTVCATINEFPYVQYQKSSPICTKLAEMLTALLNEFYQNKIYNEKRGILLLTDRSFDVTTPFLHDYNYESMVYDLFDIKDGVIQLGSQTYKIDDKDELWLKYKNKHMCIVFEQLQKDFDEFMKSDLSKVQKQELESFDEMANVLHNMKGYKTKTNQFSLHLKLAEEITNKYKSLNLYDIIELEQDIVTGINASGGTVNNKEIFTKFATMKNKLSEEDKIRIISTLHSCLDLTKSEFDMLADTISEAKKKSIYNMEWLGISFARAKSKAARREPTLNKKEIQQFKMKSKSLDYNFLRSSPKLESILESCSKYQLSRVEFPFSGEEPKNVTVLKPKNYASANMFGNDNHLDDELPFLISFTLGGLSHNEITSMEKLYEDKKLNHQLILGSTSIITAKDYIRHLDRLPQPDQLGDGRNLELKSIEVVIVD